MDQFDKAIKNTTNTSTTCGPTNILVLGTSTSTIDAIRASLEVAGHSVSQVQSISAYEELSNIDSFGIIFVPTDAPKISTELLLESVSLISPRTIVVGYSIKKNHPNSIQCIRSGFSDVFVVPEELDCVGNRIQILLEAQQKTTLAEDQAKKALRLCNKVNKERHRVEEENNALSDKLANIHCDTKKKMQQVAIGAEFQTLVNQELDIESMLRTALGYMLTRVGAMNAAVYLREGDADWGIGAFINYDRQPEQFQPLIDTLVPEVCPRISHEQQVNHFKNGEMFANTMDVDPIDFSGSEVVTYGCYYGDRCMAVVVLFRDDSRPFTEGALEIIETLRIIFGQQLGTILKIHRRAESHWPSESIDDDDWSIDRAA